MPTPKSTPKSTPKRASERLNNSPGKKKGKTGSRTVDQQGKEGKRKAGASVVNSKRATKVPRSTPNNDGMEQYVQAVDETMSKLAHSYSEFQKFMGGDPVQRINTVFKRTTTRFGQIALAWQKILGGKIGTAEEMHNLAFWIFHLIQSKLVATSSDLQHNDSATHALNEMTNHIQELTQPHGRAPGANLQTIVAVRMFWRPKDGTLHDILNKEQKAMVSTWLKSSTAAHEEAVQKIKNAKTLPQDNDEDEEEEELGGWDAEPETTAGQSAHTAAQTRADVPPDEPWVYEQQKDDHKVVLATLASIRYTPTATEQERFDEVRQLAQKWLSKRWPAIIEALEDHDLLAQPFLWQTMFGPLCQYDAQNSEQKASPQNRAEGAFVKIVRDILVPALLFSQCDSLNKEVSKTVLDMFEDKRPPAEDPAQEFELLQGQLTRAFEEASFQGIELVRHDEKPSSLVAKYLFCDHQLCSSLPILLHHKQEEQGDLTEDCGFFNSPLDLVWAVCSSTIKENWTYPFTAIPNIVQSDSDDDEDDDADESSSPTVRQICRHNVKGETIIDFQEPAYTYKCGLLDHDTIYAFMFFSGSIFTYNDYRHLKDAIRGCADDEMFEMVKNVILLVERTVENVLLHQTINQETGNRLEYFAFIAVVVAPSVFDHVCQQMISTSSPRPSVHSKGVYDVLSGLLQQNGATSIDIGKCCDSFTTHVVKMDQAAMSQLQTSKATVAVSGMVYYFDSACRKLWTTMQRCQDSSGHFEQVAFMRDWKNFFDIHTNMLANEVVPDSMEVDEDADEMQNERGTNKSEKHAEENNGKGKEAYGSPAPGEVQPPGASLRGGARAGEGSSATGVSSNIRAIAQTANEQMERQAGGGAAKVGTLLQTCRDAFNGITVTVNSAEETDSKKKLVREFLFLTCKQFANMRVYHNDAKHADGFIMCALTEAVIQKINPDGGNMGSIHSAIAEQLVRTWFQLLVPVTRSDNVTVHVPRRNSAQRTTEIWSRFLCENYVRRMYQHVSRKLQTTYKPSEETTMDQHEENALKLVETSYQKLFDDGTAAQWVCGSCASCINLINYVASTSKKLAQAELMSTYKMPEPERMLELAEAERFDFNKHIHCPVCEKKCNIPDIPGIWRRADECHWRFTCKTPQCEFWSEHAVDIMTYKDANDKKFYEKQLAPDSKDFTLSEAQLKLPKNKQKVIEKKLANKYLKVQQALKAVKERLAVAAQYERSMFWITATTESIKELKQKYEDSKI